MRKERERDKEERERVHTGRGGERGNTERRRRKEEEMRTGEGTRRGEELLELLLCFLSRFHFSEWFAFLSFPFLNVPLQNLSPRRRAEPCQY